MATNFLPPILVPVITLVFPGIVFAYFFLITQAGEIE